MKTTEGAIYFIIHSIQKQHLNFWNRNYDINFHSSCNLDNKNQIAILYWIFVHQNMERETYIYSDSRLILIPDYYSSRFIWNCIFHNFFERLCNKHENKNHSWLHNQFKWEYFFSIRCNSRCYQSVLNLFNWGKLYSSYKRFFNWLVVHIVPS